MRFIPKRRWFRFSLRTLLVLTAVVAVVLGVVGYHVRWMGERRTLLRQDDVIGLEGDRAPGVLWFFGEEGVKLLFVKEEDEARAGELFPEAFVVAANNSTAPGLRFDIDP